MHLTDKKIAIIATDHFEEAELTSPKQALEDAGATVEVIAPHDGEIKGLNHLEPGKSIAVDKTLDQANPEEYDGVVIPGGVVNSDHLRMEEKARDFVRKMVGEGKPTAAICHGPWLLVSARQVRGKRLTSYPTLQDDIVNAGGEWTDEQVITDGCLITSRKPDDLPAFNEAIIKALSAK